MKQGAVRRSNDIYVMAEGNRGKPQQGDRLMKIVRRVIAWYSVPYLQMPSVGSYGTSGRDKKGKKKRMETELADKSSNNKNF